MFSNKIFLIHNQRNVFVRSVQLLKFSNNVNKQFYRRTFLTQFSNFQSNLRNSPINAFKNSIDSNFQSNFNQKSTKITVATITTNSTPDVSNNVNEKNRNQKQRKKNFRFKKAAKIGLTGILISLGIVYFSIGLIVPKIFEKYLERCGLIGSMGAFSVSPFLSHISISDLNIENIGGKEAYHSKDFVCINKIDIKWTSDGIDVILDEVSINLERSGFLSTTFNFSEVLEHLSDSSSSSSSSSSSTSKSLTEKSINTKNTQINNNNNNDSTAIRSIKLKKVNAILRLASVVGISPPVHIVIPSINVDNGRSSMVNSIPEATRVVIGAVVLTVLATAGNSVSGVASASTSVVKSVGSQSLDVARIMTMAPLQAATHTLNYSMSVFHAIGMLTNVIIHGVDVNHKVQNVAKQYKTQLTKRRQMLSEIKTK